MKPRAPKTTSFSTSPLHSQLPFHPLQWEADTPLSASGQTAPGPPGPGSPALPGAPSSPGWKILLPSANTTTKGLEHHKKMTVVSGFPRTLKEKVLGEQKCYFLASISIAYKWQPMAPVCNRQRSSSAYRTLGCLGEGEKGASLPDTSRVGKNKAGLWAACRNHRHCRWTLQLPQTMQEVWNQHLLTRQKTKTKTELSLSFRGQMDCTGGRWTLLPCKALLQPSPLELASAKCPWSAVCVCSLWKGQKEANERVFKSSITDPQ